LRGPGGDLGDVLPDDLWRQQGAVVQVALLALAQGRLGAPITALGAEGDDRFVGLQALTTLADEVRI